VLLQNQITLPLQVETMSQQQQQPSSSKRQLEGAEDSDPKRGPSIAAASNSDGDYNLQYSLMCSTSFMSSLSEILGAFGLLIWLGSVCTVAHYGTLSLTLCLSFLNVYNPLSFYPPSACLSRLIYFNYSYSIYIIESHTGPMEVQLTV
jgi:hypothetical protein